MQLGESFLLKPSPKKISYIIYDIYNEKLFEKTFGVTKNKNYYLLLRHKRRCLFTLITSQ